MGAENEAAGAKSGLESKEGETADTESAGGHPVGLGADGKPVEEWEYLDTFYKRHNKVLLDKLAIEREHQRLQQENAELQSILGQYWDGTTVNENVIQVTEKNEMKANPLLVVNGRVNLNAPPVRRAVKPAYIEGAIELGNIQRSLR